MAQCNHSKRISIAAPPPDITYFFSCRWCCCLWNLDFKMVSWLERCSLRPWTYVDCQSCQVNGLIILIETYKSILLRKSLPRSWKLYAKLVLVCLPETIIKVFDGILFSHFLSYYWSLQFHINSLSTFSSPVIMPLSRRTNELKSEIDISDDLIEKFKNFWSHFRDTPLKGKKSMLPGKYSAYFFRNYYEQLFPCHRQLLRMVLVNIYAKFFNVLVKSGRNAILRGICPQVFGLFTVKLAGILLYACFFCQHLFSLSCLNLFVCMCNVFICSCFDTYWRCATCWCFWYKSTGRISLASYWWSRLLSITEYYFCYICMPLNFGGVPNFLLELNWFWTRRNLACVFLT